MIRRLRAHDAEEMLTVQRIAPHIQWSSDFIEGFVATDESDVPKMVIVSLAIVESHMGVDHSWLTPRKRYEAFLKLQDLAVTSAHNRGFKRAWCWIPKMRAFARRLKALGWTEGELGLVKELHHG